MDFVQPAADCLFRVACIICNWGGGACVGLGCASELPGMVGSALGVAGATVLGAGNTVQGMGERAARTALGVGDTVRGMGEHAAGTALGVGDTVRGMGEHAAGTALGVADALGGTGRHAGRAEQDVGSQFPQTACGFTYYPGVSVLPGGAIFGGPNGSTTYTVTVTATTSHRGGFVPPAGQPE